MIAERVIENSFLIFFKIDVGMLLGLMLLLELRACIKSDISSGVVGVMNSSAFGFLKSDSHLPKKFLFICLNESPLKLMKNAFYFILKALFVLKIFKFLC